MPRRFLAATDLTPASKRAVRYAVDLAEATGADLEVLHVAVADQAKAAQARLRAFAFGLGKRRLPVITTVEDASDPAAGVLNAANRADLLILGTHGASGDDAGLGPVARAVTRRARVPVLLVGPAAGRARLGMHIVVPVDLSAAAAAALREADRLATELGGTVKVVHAVPERPEGLWGGEAVEAQDELPSEARLRHVERFVSETLADRASGVEIRVTAGSPAEAVARVAREEGADLIVAGRPADRPAATEALLDAAIRASRCPAASVPSL